LLNAADSATTLVAAMVVSIVLARTLGPDRFGLYALVTTVVTFTFLFARLGVGDTVRRYMAELDGRDQRPLGAVLAGWGLKIGISAAIVAAVALMLAAGPLSGFFRRSEIGAYLLIGAASLLPTAAASVLRNLQRGLQHWRALLWLNLATSPLWVGACALAVWRGAGIAGVLVAGIAIEVINVGVLAIWARRDTGWPRLRTPLPAELRSRVLRYNFGLAVLVVMNVIVWQRSELIFLGRFSGPEQVAYYAVPFSLTQRITELLPGAVLGVLLPSLSFAYGTADPARFGEILSTASRYLAMLALPICAFGIPLAGAGIALLYGSAYLPAVPVLQILLAASIFGVAGQAASAALLGMEQQSWLLKTGLAAVALSLALDFLLIPRWGAIGAAIANGVTQASWAVAVTAPLLRRVSHAARKAVARSALVAVVLGLLLTLTLLAGFPALALLVLGSLAAGLYVAALARMRLLRVTAS
jgi:O-antigen/teichoic acid export membrane protein